MNPQVAHALKQVGIAMAIAALAALGQHLADIPIDPQYGASILIIVGALIPAVIRVLEGYQDNARAKAFDMREADVGYNQLMAFKGESHRVTL